MDLVAKFEAGTVQGWTEAEIAQLEPWMQDQLCADIAEETAWNQVLAMINTETEALLADA